MLIETILLFAIAVVITLVYILAILGRLLFAYNGQLTKGTILAVEAEEKYFDHTRAKRTAFNYPYEYIDKAGVRHRGKLLNNTPEIEFAANDTIDIIYLRRFPAVSLYYPTYRSMQALPWILFLLCALFWLFCLL